MKTTSRLVVLLVGVLLSSFAGHADPVVLKVGDPVPEFKLPASDGQDYTAAQFAGKKAIALCWFPRAGSKGALAQCAALEAVMAKVPTGKVQVLGCSTATLDATKTFAKDGKYSFPILADADSKAAEAFGCLRANGTAERWTFLIDDQGTILAIDKSVTPQTQGTELIKLLEAAGLLKQDAPKAP